MEPSSAPVPPAAGAEAPPAAELERRLLELAERRREAVRRAFSRLHPLALGFGVGSVAGLAVLLPTLVLAARGGVAPGADIAETLRSLKSYFPGYSIEFAGALVGALYGFAVGFVAGWGVATFRNLALALVLGFARWTAEQWRRRHLMDEI